VRDIAPELIGKSVSPRARMRRMEKRLKLVGWQGSAGMVVGGKGRDILGFHVGNQDFPTSA
jgi:hypothetical protein